MLCRVHVLLPYFISVVTGVSSRPIRFRVGGAAVLVYLPRASTVHQSDFGLMAKEPITQLTARLGPATPDPEQPSPIEINGVPAIQADLLTLEFRRRRFDRRAFTSPRTIAERLAQGDPSANVVVAAANKWLATYRSLARVHLVRSLDPSRTIWQSRYLRDDGSELRRRKGFIRGFNFTTETSGISILAPEAWDATRELADRFEPPAWDSLLLDAMASLPMIEPAIALA